MTRLAERIATIAGTKILQRLFVPKDEELSPSYRVIRVGDSKVIFSEEEQSVHVLVGGDEVLRVSLYHPPVAIIYSAKAALLECPDELEFWTRVAYKATRDSGMLPEVHSSICSCIFGEDG